MNSSYLSMLVGIAPFVPFFAILLILNCAVNLMTASTIFFTDVTRHFSAR